MTSADIQRQLVRRLRDYPMGLDQFQLAADIGQAAFRVRQELRTLRRERIVQDYFRTAGVVWKLTDRGLADAYADEQTEMFR